MKKKIIFAGGSLIIFFVLLIMLTILTEKQKFEKTDYSKMNLTGINKMMVVAHPDDEMLWGGTKLLQDDYLVVCITCGSDMRRVKEFESVMERTGDAYIMLGYPDKTRGERDDWSKVRDNLVDDLKNIYDLKKWDEVVTHNPEGEYGHIHHKMTSSFVSVISDKSILKYFGKYYSKNKLKENDIVLSKMPEEILYTKKEILKLYVTQKTTIEKFSHMIASEEIVYYKDWIKMYNEKNR